MTDEGATYVSGTTSLERLLESGTQGIALSPVEPSRKMARLMVPLSVK